jgi:membrane protein
MTAASTSITERAMLGLIQKTKDARSVLRWLARQWTRRRMPGLAAESAFWLFFSLIPLVAVAGMVAAKFASSKRVDEWLPLLSGASPAAHDFLNGELDRVSAWNSGTVGPLAAAMFFWLASSGLHALFDALQANLGQTRSWLRTRGAALIGCLLLSVAVTALVGAGTLVAKWQPLVGSSAWATWGSRLLAFAWSFLFARGIFRIGLSPKERRCLPLSVGAAVAAVLQTLVGAVYVLSLKLMGDGSAYLAGLASIGVTLTALFFYALALLIGLSLSQLFKRTARCKRLAVVRDGHANGQVDASPSKSAL